MYSIGNVFETVFENLYNAYSPIQIGIGLIIMLIYKFIYNHVSYIHTKYIQKKMSVLRNAREREGIFLNVRNFDSKVYI